MKWLPELWKKAYNVLKPIFPALIKTSAVVFRVLRIQKPSFFESDQNLSINQVLRKGKKLLTVTVSKIFLGDSPERGTVCLIIPGLFPVHYRLRLNARGNYVLNCDKWWPKTSMEGKWSSGTLVLWKIKSLKWLGLSFIRELVTFSLNIYMLTSDTVFFQYLA